MRKRLLRNLQGHLLGNSQDSRRVATRPRSRGRATAGWMGMIAALLAVIMVPSGGVDAQGPAVGPATIVGLDGRVVQLINVDTHRFLDGSTNGNVDQTFRPSEGDRWRFERVPGSVAPVSWRLYNIERPGYLTAEGSGADYNVGLSDAVDDSTRWIPMMLDDGSFTLRSALDGRYLDADNSRKRWNVDTSPDGDEIDTHWRIALAVQPDEVFDIGDLDQWVVQLQNVQTSGFADGNTNGNVDQSVAPSNGDRWLVTSESNDEISLYNIERPGYLTAADAGQGYNAYLGDSVTDAAKWSLIREGDGRNLLVNAATGRFLDADGYGSGWNVDTTTKRYDRDSMWRINVLVALPPDTSPPSLPAGLALDPTAVSQTTLGVTWNASQDNREVVAYLVFLDGDIIAELDADARSYLIDGLVTDTSYEVGVEAVDRAGNTSTRASITAATEPPPDTEAPSSPVLVGLPGDVGDTTVLLRWEASTDNRAVTGYRIFVFGVPLADVDANQFDYLVTDLVPDEDVRLGVAAFDAAGNQSSITEVTFRTLEACGVGNDLERLVECVSIDNLKVHLEAFQAHADANGGTREASGPGFQASVDYAAGLLSDAGYDVTIQPFDYPVFTEIEIAELEQVSPVPTVYEYATDTGFLTMSYSGSGNVTALTQGVDLIDPTGQPANTSTSGCEIEDFDDFEAGRIAILQRGACAFSTKALNAQDAGAVGVVIFNEGQDGRDSNFGGTLGAETVVTIPVVGASYAVGIELAGDPAAGVEVTARLFAFTMTEVRSSSNVFAELPTGDLNNTIMVGAHLDSVPSGPGVQDNGSGSAAVLETALQMAKGSPTNHVRFALWGAEESGLIGSEYYVFTLPDAEREQIAGYLNFDMIASPNHFFGIYDGDDSDGVGAPAGPPGSDAIEQVFEGFYDNCCFGGGAAVIPYQGTDFSGRSDYGPFIFFGIPSGGLFTGAEGIKTPEEAALYGGTAGIAYDPCYHQACDTIDNVNFDVLDLNSDAVAYATWTLAYTDVISGLIAPAALRVDRDAFVGIAHGHEGTLHAHGVGEKK